MECYQIRQRDNWKLAPDRGIKLKSYQTEVSQNNHWSRSFTKGCSGSSFTKDLIKQKSYYRLTQTEASVKVAQTAAPLKILSKKFTKISQLTIELVTRRDSQLSVVLVKLATKLLRKSNSATHINEYWPKSH